MTSKEFLNAVANGRKDIVQVLLDLLAETGCDYCVIGGLAVNAYTEPVVSLDLDIVVIAEKVDALCDAAKAKGFTVGAFGHSINMAAKESDLRIQVQKDERYQPFLSRAKLREVLGYSMRVAEPEDVLQGKVWAYLDEGRRKSKRQKDLADIARLAETIPSLKDLLSKDIQAAIS